MPSVFNKAFSICFLPFLVSFSTTWTWSRQIFRKLLDVQQIECQRLVCTCWVSTSLAPNLDLIHFHNGNGFISRSPNMKPVLKRTKNSLPSAVKHKTRANRVKILYQAWENTKPVPSSGKWHKISLTIQANFFLLVNVHLLLTENGISLFMWIGLQVDPSWLNQVFGAHTIGQVDIEMVRFFLKSYLQEEKKQTEHMKRITRKDDCAVGITVLYSN